VEDSDSNSGAAVSECLKLQKQLTEEELVLNKQRPGGA
jgi:hypothetical protein